MAEKGKDEIKRSLRIFGMRFMELRGYGKFSNYGFTKEIENYEIYTDLRFYIKLLLMSKNLPTSLFLN